MALHHTLLDRMAPPQAARPSAAATGSAQRGPRPAIDRALHLATQLFDVGAAALVLPAPAGFQVARVSAGAEWCTGRARGAARGLFEALTPAGAATPATGDRTASVLEELVPGGGFTAATPIRSSGGRHRGAVCLVDRGRKTLLTALQRRLFAEFGDLLASCVPEDDTVAPASDRVAMSPQDSAGRLQELADRQAEAFALFDTDGRCLLRNRSFDALLALTPDVTAWPSIPAAVGREAEWLTLQLGRDLEPVGVYRTARADGRWLCIEERRHPRGRSLLARLEARAAQAAATLTS